MKTCLVTGAKGFIGSAIAAEAERLGFEVIAVDLDNYEQLRGSKADILVNAAGNSRKFIDDKDPARGFELSVTSVMRIMLDFKFERFVHLSSGAVYPNEGNPSLNAEKAEINPSQMTCYGFHKWLAEQVVRHYAPRHLIIRMGGFVGPGLRKNAVFDILTGGQLFVHPDSEFQYMDTRDLARLVFDLADGAAGNETLFNLSSAGSVPVRRIAEWAGYKLTRDPLVCPKVRAELNVEKAVRALALPETGETVRRFIEEVQSGKVKLK